MLNFMTDEHRMISDSARRMFDDLCAVDGQARLKSKQRITPQQVKQGLQDIGLFSAVDGDFMDTSLVQSLLAMESGRASLPYPLLENLAARYVRAHAADNDADEADHLPTTLPSLADAVSALPLLKNGVLSGTVKAVPFADISDRMLVRARRAATNGNDETVLIRLDLAQAGIERSSRKSVEDDYPVFDVSINNLKTDKDWITSELNKGRNAAEALDLHCSLLAAAEMAGVGEKLINMTRDYLLVRSQFGNVLGANQALKHRMADHFAKLEALKAAVSYAAAALDAGAEDAKAAVCSAKHFAGQIGKPLAEDMLQMHGAIAFTMEYPLHLFMRRMLRLSASYGSTYAQGEMLYREFQEIA